MDSSDIKVVVVALGLFLTIIICNVVAEIEVTNREALKQGLIRQYNSNVSGWVKK
jgi:hypothetical protein